MVKKCENGKLVIHFSKSLLSMGRPLSEMLGAGISVYHQKVEGVPGYNLQCTFVLRCDNYLYLVRDEELAQLAANERVWLLPMPMPMN